MKEAIFYGVRCGIIHPGFTDTPMARQLGPEFLEKYVLPFTQLRRLIRTEEIADGCRIDHGHPCARLRRGIELL